jgi:hypothetical protein
MIMQQKRRKLSSQRAKLLRRLQEAELDFEQRLQAAEDLRFFPEELREAMLQYDLESANDPTAFVRVTARDELLAERRRPLLLIELANLQDGGIAQFQKSLQSRKSTRPAGRFFTVSDAALLRLRDELITIWKAGARGELLTKWKDSIPKGARLLPPEEHELGNYVEVRPPYWAPRAAAHQVMIEWLRWKPHKGDVRDTQQYSPFFPSLEFGSILLDTRNLHAQMTQAVLERIENMRICGNPKCANPYFLARRNDQKYCEQGSCTIYGHRRSALDYWHRKHKSNEESGKRSTKSEKGKKKWA